MSTEKKIWTFEAMDRKVRKDTRNEEDNADEEFIDLHEMIGYFNEAIDEAESEIMVLNQDYFLTYDFMPLVLGEDEYDLPINIFGRKFRAIMYENGNTIYRVHKFRMFNKFESVAFAAQNAGSDDYRYYLTNDRPGGEKLILVPLARETALIPPLATTFTPIRRWYIRQANRIPYEGEYTNREYFLPTAVDTTANTLTCAPEVAYATGDALKFEVGSGYALPAPLVSGTVYYAIAVSATSLKLATSLANARAGTAIDLTTQGTGFFNLQVAATEAIINATIVDIPEFSTFVMEWVKANCLFADGDPRLSGCVAKLEQQRKMMQDTLAESEPDNDDEISPDFSSYTEMS